MCTCPKWTSFFHPNCHLIPPLRSLRDRAALRAGLLDGTVDASAPITRRSTRMSSSCRSPKRKRCDRPGIAAAAGAEVGAAGKTHIARCTRKATLQPAQILGLDAGHLSIGAVADVWCSIPKHTGRLRRLR